MRVNAFPITIMLASFLGRVDLIIFSDLDLTEFVFAAYKFSSAIFQRLQDQIPITKNHRGSYVITLKLSSLV